MKGIYVYLIRSMTFPKRRYVGLSRDPEMRLSEHNSGVVGVTRRYRKWEMVAAVWFKEMKKAEAFEKYLKHGSGHAFARRHFL